MNSPAQNRKELSRIQGSENKKNNPTKVTERSLVSVNISDSDDDLALQLLQVKRQAAKKLPLGPSPSKSNKSVMK
jgi:hypothetical protein